MKTLVNLLSSAIFLILMQGAAFGQGDMTFDELMSKHKKDLNISSKYQLDRTTKLVMEGVAHSNTLMSFIDDGFKNKEYEMAFEWLVKYRIGPIEGNFPFVEDAESIIETYRSYEQRSPYGTIKNALSKTVLGMSVLELMKKQYDGLYNNDKVDLADLKKAYDLSSGYILGEIGDQLLHTPGLIGGAIAVFDMALTHSIKTTFSRHEKLVYEAYENYVANKYSKESFVAIVVNPNLTETEKTAKIESQLYEFWDDAIIHLDQYIKDQDRKGIVELVGNTARVVGLKDKFRDEYFTTYLAGPISWRLRQMAENDKIQARLWAQSELAAANAQMKKAAWLKKKLESIKIIEPDSEELAGVDIVKIDLLPVEAVVKKDSRDLPILKVIAETKSGDLFDITKLAQIGSFDPGNPGVYNVQARYKIFSDESTIKVVADPKLKISPEYMELDINQSDKTIDFQAVLIDEYEKVLDVTEKAFSSTTAGTHIYEFENVGRYEVLIKYVYQGQNLYATATIDVIGCEDPDKTINPSTGQCECDRERGYVENPESDGCIKKEEIEESSDECPEDRYYIDENGECVCKFVVDSNGDCLTEEELEERMNADNENREVDCAELESDATQLYSEYNSQSIQSLINMQNHTEFGLTYVNDLTESPCQDPTFIRSVALASSEKDRLGFIRDEIDMSLLAMIYEGASCPDVVRNYTANVQSILDQIQIANNNYNTLMEAFYSFNCTSDDIDALTPESVQDPTRSPEGESGMEGSGSGTAGDVIQGLDDIVVTQRDVTITVWDHEIADEDIVTIKINNKVVLRNHEITKAQHSFQVTLPSGKNTMTVIAVSAGTDGDPNSDKTKNINTAAILVSHAIEGGRQVWRLGHGARVQTNFIVQK